MINNTVRLGPLETHLLANWERLGQRDITTAELRTEIGEKNAREVIRRLVRSGLLARVARGSYMTMPLRNLARKQAVSPITMLPALLRDTPYYVGGRRAWTHHRLTQQVYISALDVFVNRAIRRRTVGGVSIEFHVLSDDKFAYGTEDATIEGREIPVSDIARTLLDALDYPKSIGDTETAIRQVTVVLPRADPEMLVRYAVIGSRIATCQRLGLLLERGGVAAGMLSPLRKYVAVRGSIQAMLPKHRRRGPISKVWKIIENDLEIDT